MTLSQNRRSSFKASSPRQLSVHEGLEEKEEGARARAGKTPGAKEQSGDETREPETGQRAARAGKGLGGSRDEATGPKLSLCSGA